MVCCLPRFFSPPVFSRQPLTTLRPSPPPAGASTDELNLWALLESVEAGGSAEQTQLATADAEGGPLRPARVSFGRLDAAHDALVARIGGEEFAILLPADRAIDATTILDRLRAERMPFDLTVTASIGASTGPLLTEIDWKKLYRRADRALFAAKTAGRDRVRYDMAMAA